MPSPLTPTYDTTTSFRSGCGNVNLCTDYYNVPTQVGGYSSISDDNEFYKTSGGSKAKKCKKCIKVKCICKKKCVKKLKGGFTSEEDNSKGTETTNIIMGGGKKKRSLKGGNATPMHSRFYDANGHLDDYSELSGDGVNTEYGTIDAKDIGTGLLAPYNVASCNQNGGYDNDGYNDNEIYQSGGKSKKSVLKKSSKSVKKGSKSKKSLRGGFTEKGDISGFSFNNLSHGMVQEELHHGGGKSKKSLRGGFTEEGDIPGFSFNDSSYGIVQEELHHGGGKSKSKKSLKSSKAKRSLKGGNATPMHSRFYDANGHLDDYSELSGDGVNTEYGTIDAKDIGTGLLAPYNTATGSCNQTGGGGPIPGIPDAPITMVEKGIGSAIDGFTGFLSEFQQKYLQSIESIKNIKIGNHRLIGGKKEKKTKKSKKSKKMKGGNGSDWAVSQGSRGPENSPDSYWGVPGETWFRQFNKTGEYIPNSDLKYSATPELAGMNDINQTVDGYDPIGTSYGQIGGKVKNKKSKSMKSKSMKSKSMKSKSMKSKSMKSKSMKRVSL